MKTIGRALRVTFVLAAAVLLAHPIGADAAEPKVLTERRVDSNWTCLECHSTFGGSSEFPGLWNNVYGEDCGLDAPGPDCSKCFDDWEPCAPSLMSSFELCEANKCALARLGNLDWFYDLNTEDSEQVADALSSHVEHLVLNVKRKSIQLIGACDGGIVANIPLKSGNFEVLVAAMELRSHQH